MDFDFKTLSTAYAERMFPLRCDTTPYIKCLFVFVCVANV